MLNNIKYNAAIKKMYNMDQVHLAHMYDVLRKKKSDLNKRLKFLRKQELTYNLEILEVEQKLYQVNLSMSCILQVMKYRKNKFLEESKKTKKILIEEEDFVKMLFEPLELRWYQKIWPFKKSIKQG